MLWHILSFGTIVLISLNHYSMIDESQRILTVVLEFLILAPI